MSDADARLQRLFTAELPPASDPAFRVAVLERRALGQFRDRMLLLFIAGLAVTACLAAIAATLPAQAVAILGKDIWPGICVAVAVLSTVWGVAQMRRTI